MQPNPVTLMKHLISIFSATFLLLTFCKAQDKTDSTVFYNKEFKWRITIPVGFDTISSAEMAILQNRGKVALEKTAGRKVKDNTKKLCVFRSGQSNSFECSTQPYEVKKQGSYIKTCDEVNKLLYKTFELQMPGVKIDSSCSTIVVNGLTFQSFNLAATLPNQITLHVYTYSRLFEKREFAVSIIAIDREKEKQLLNAWLNSKFEK